MTELLGYSNKTKNSKIVLDINNEICFEPKTVAQYMNEFFLNVASSLVNKLPVPPNIFTTNSDLIKRFYAEKNVTPNSFLLNPVSKEFVNLELSRLSVNKSPGYDEIPAKFPKECGSEIKGVITYLVNLSIRKNEFPDELKFAKIKPIILHCFTVSLYPE